MQGIVSLTLKGWLLCVPLLNAGVARADVSCGGGGILALEASLPLDPWSNS